MRTVLHSDLNNFFASVECRMNPSLNEYPVAVCGDPEKRHGIILAKNYKAKKYGVATGEALWEAKLKCPDIVFVPPHYEEYMKYSSAVREIYHSYTNLVEPYGLDECWLDVTGSEKLFGDGKTIADSIRERVKKELGLTVSVGVSYNKIFAKLGSDMKKPDATTVIPKERFREVVWRLPAEELLYIGPSTKRKLLQYGIKTIGQLAQTDDSLLSYLFGKNGLMLKAFANGEDSSPVADIEAENNMKSLSCGTTAFRDLVCEDDVKIMLMELSSTVSARLRAQGYLCKTVQLVIRNKDLSTIVRRKKLSYPTRTSQAIYTAAMELFCANHLFEDPVRSLSVCAADIFKGNGEQLSFDEEIFTMQRRENLESATDGINEKFGKGTVRRGLTMLDEKLCGIDIRNCTEIMPGRMNGI